MEINKTMEQIRESDLKIASLNKEIKEMERERKIKEDGIASAQMMEKQMEHNNSYKEKVLVDIEGELKIYEKQYEIWKGILEKKQGVKLEEEKSLDDIRSNVWSTRTTFCEDIGKFLENNDYLIYGGRKIQEAILQKEEDNKLERELNLLESEVTELEMEKSKLEENRISLKDMEKQREALAMEPETSPVFQSMKRKLQELEEIELKMHSPAKIGNHNKLMPGQKILKIISPAKRVSGSQENGLTYFLKERNVYIIKNFQGIKSIPSFVPKVPSNLKIGRKILGEKTSNVNNV